MKLAGPAWTYTTLSVQFLVGYRQYPVGFPKLLQHRYLVQRRRSTIIKKKNQKKKRYYSILSCRQLIDFNSCRFSSKFGIVEIFIVGKCSFFQLFFCKKYFIKNILHMATVGLLELSISLARATCSLLVEISNRK